MTTPPVSAAIVALRHQQDLLVSNLDGQIVAELRRWDEVRARVLTDHPDIRKLWEDSIDETA